MKNSKIIFIDLSYYYSKNVTDYKQLMINFESASGHHSYLAKSLNLHVIRHINQNVSIQLNQANYYFLKGVTSKLWLPLRLHRFIKSLKPDAILVHGYSNPIQLFLLCLQTKAPIIIQDHGGPLPGGYTGFMQKIVKYFVKNYFFTSKEQVTPFISKGLIHQKSEIHEIMEGSTHKKRIEKNVARKQLNISIELTVYLWVGRLNKNKDPLTVLKGLELFFKTQKFACLYMIYEDGSLEKEVREFIKQSVHLKNNVHLKGKIAHHELDNFYCSADYFILGSHYEGSGFALCESMACGCIPIVTEIPSFKKMTHNGSFGALWEPGNVESLLNAILKTSSIDIQTESQKVVHFFEQNLSFNAIAETQFEALNKIIKRK